MRSCFIIRCTVLLFNQMSKFRKKEILDKNNLAKTLREFASGIEAGELTFEENVYPLPEKISVKQKLSLKKENTLKFNLTLKIKDISFPQKAKKELAKKTNLSEVKQEMKFVFKTLQPGTAGPETTQRFIDLSKQMLEMADAEWKELAKEFLLKSEQLSHSTGTKRSELLAELSKMKKDCHSQYK